MNAALQAERRRVHHAAMTIEATEAILFHYDPADTEPLTTALHLRGGERRPAALVEVEAALRSIVGVHLATGEDAAIRIATGDATREPRFCFVQVGTKRGKIARAAAFIRRCRDEAAANDVLAQIRERRIFN